MEKDLKYIEGFEEFYKNYINNFNFKTAIVTNTTRLSYQKIEQCVNISKYFNFSITVTESKAPKPSPIPFLQAMDHLKLKPIHFDHLQL